MFRISLVRSLCFSLNLSQKSQYSVSRSSFNYEIVHPHAYNTIKRSFPNDIQLPIYSQDDVLNDFKIFEDKIKDYKDLSRDQTVIKGVRDACRIAKEILENVKEFIKVINFH